MSIQKEIRTIPAKTAEYTVSVTCDLCGEVFEEAREGVPNIEWAAYGDIQETCVQIEEGYGHLDGGDKRVRAYHICCKCFKTKLEPWLQSQGAKPTIREIDW